MDKKYQQHPYSGKEFNEKYYYDQNDLGAIYSSTCTQFKVWAPTANNVKVKLYKDGHTDSFINQYNMSSIENGVWSLAVEQDLNGIYYTYEVTIGDTVNETIDPYAKAAGVNGERGMVIDLEKTNPKDWSTDTRPAFTRDTDAVIYELHVRDLSMDSNSGIEYKGKFLGVAEEGTKSESGQYTGLSHMKELGITHLHLLPVFDYHTVDETKLDTPQFNWGYDPKNFNLPEGSYATDPYHGEVRIKEFKQMVQALHRNGIRVVMDVVYNHTFADKNSNFHKIMPEYYHRVAEGVFSDGSACGNETASERSMVRKFMIDSVTYWAKEYHIDGFRFDLMALHDIETMNEIRKAVDAIDPSILLYGEGWTGSDSVLPKKRQALKAHTYQLNRVGAFSDDMRDAIKGSVFDGEDYGFVSGKKGLEEAIRFGIVAATSHPQVTEIKAWTHNPGQCINYTSVHDNFTLWDKLSMSRKDASKEDRIRMNKLSAAIILTSQGIPLFLAGEELLRSKPVEGQEGMYDHNSYVSSDVVNAIRWENKKTYQDVYKYYQGLIAFRKQHAALRMETEKEIQEHLTFMDTPEQVVAYRLHGPIKQETAKEIYVIFNASEESVTIKLPEGKYGVYVNEEKAGVNCLAEMVGDQVSVERISAMVLIKEEA
ncbi:type I pullulanase [Anaerosporobacter faecicola]|uniref:type I pullulanase n=1 Tax=Anaerosporobacter faecicola TaxID=2718714 RepID=UPI00143BB050|nr:type I pullulanase [Anaerosporobacter faecicola]